jgi:DNA-binding NarL/FixJ family response regulator
MGDGAPVRVVIADDQALIRTGLRMMIDGAPDLTVVAEAATGREAVRVTRESAADLVLMDIRMPDLDGLAATRQITAAADLAAVKVLILTTFEVDEYVFEALRGGASGFLGKGAAPEVLLDAIRSVARGDALLSPLATRSLISRFLAQRDPGPPPAAGKLDVLTDREREVVALAADGLSNAEIASHLSLSPLTVKTHANHAMAKLSVRDRAQLVILAYQTGLVRPPSALYPKRVVVPVCGSSPPVAMNRGSRMYRDRGSVDGFAGLRGRACQPLPDGHRQQVRDQVLGAAQHPGRTFGSHPAELGPAGRRRARWLGIRSCRERVADVVQLVVEAAGDEAVPAFVRVQAVDTPVAALIGLRVRCGVEVQRAEALCDVVDRLVDRLHPPRQRPGQRVRQPEHFPRIRQPHGEHLSARRLERAHCPCY